MTSEVYRDLPGGRYLRLRQMGANLFHLKAFSQNSVAEGNVTAQEAIEAMAAMISAYLKDDLAGDPGAKALGEETMGFMQDAVNAFPELAERYRFMTEDEPGAGVN